MKLQTCHWKSTFGFLNRNAQHRHRFNNAWLYVTRYWKNNRQVSNEIWFHNQTMKLKSLNSLVIHLQFSLKILDRIILPIRYTIHKKLQETELSKNSSYLKPISLRYPLTQQLYHKTSLILWRCKPTNAYEKKEKNNSILKQIPSLSQC